MSQRPLIPALFLPNGGARGPSRHDQNPETCGHGHRSRPKSLLKQPPSTKCNFQGLFAPIEFSDKRSPTQTTSARAVCSLFKSRRTSKQYTPNANAASPSGWASSYSCSYAPATAPSLGLVSFCGTSSSVSVYIQSRAPPSSREAVRDHCSSTK
jgi:hypothetical protein